MKILIDLQAKGMKPSRALAPMIRLLCQTLVVANRAILKSSNIPSLYMSGVRYRPEPLDWNCEHFDNAQTCFHRGWGDCDDLASWRVAELQNQGIKADIIVCWKPARGGRLYHIKVRLPNGREEDPSARLGMRSVERRQ